MIFNDITARDIQRGEMRSGVFSFCKAIDTFCPLGPWIVTPDEIRDPHDLAMELRVNGEVRQESHSSRMSVTIPEILSNFSALGYSAGDVLSTGTVSGVAGFKSKEERARLYLKPGDVIEAEIERIGVLRNPVVSWQEGHGTAAAAAGAPVGRRRVTLEPRRREARARPRADGRARARRARRPRARQRPLPDELLGDEGLRRVRLPARGRAGADLPRGVGGGRRAHRLDERRALHPRLRRRTIRGRCRRARSTPRSPRRRTTAASASSSRSARRRPTAWSASRRRSRRAGSTRGRTLRDAMPRAQRRARDQDRRRRSSGCGSRTRSAPPRWSTSAACCGRG